MILYVVYAVFPVAQIHYSLSIVKIRLILPGFHKENQLNYVYTDRILL